VQPLLAEGDQFGSPLTSLVSESTVISSRRKRSRICSITYTEAMNEIEQILDRFRREEMTVDSLTKEVKRATELIALCKERLHRTEEELKKISE
jgi:exodeoxyribonuclease VII small subunit